MPRNRCRTSTLSHAEIHLLSWCQSPRDAATLKPLGNSLTKDKRNECCFIPGGGRRGLKEHMRGFRASFTWPRKHAALDARAWLCRLLKGGPSCSREESRAFTQRSPIVANRHILSKITTDRSQAWGGSIAKGDTRAEPPADCYMRHGRTAARPTRLSTSFCVTKLLSCFKFCARYANGTMYAKTHAYGGQWD